MKSAYKQVAEVFGVAIRRAFPAVQDGPLVVPHKNPKKGHFQCNSAMPIFNKLRKEQNPPESAKHVAQMIIDNVPDDNGVVVKETLEVAGPGLISAFLAPALIEKSLASVISEGVVAKADEPKKVIVDFSSPNIAKEMHVGHLRSTIIGDCICRVLEFLGHDVQRVNHVGDWGTQFGMLITRLKEAHPDFATNTPDIGNLQEFYRSAKERFDNDDAFWKASHDEAGDEDALRGWRSICDVSRREFEKVYSRLDIKIKEVGESFYNPMIGPLIDELMEKGLAEENEGAICFFNKGKKVPLILRKSDGGYGYDSTDMACIRHRLHTENADWLVYVTDLGQWSHFELVFAASEKCGWTGNKRIDHVGFGLVQGTDGKKFKTRSGDVVKLVDLLDEARDRCLNILKERSQTDDTHLSDEELRRAAEVIGYGAVKYADLKQNRQSNYVFSFDKMLQLQGNTAVYLMYAYARIRSIIRKAEQPIDEVAKTASISLEEPAEVELGGTCALGMELFLSVFLLLSIVLGSTFILATFFQRHAAHLVRFPDILERTAHELLPNFLCEYLYELSGKYNQFYRDCRVIGDENEQSRLLLCECTARVMEATFGVIGIEVLDRI